MANDQEEGKTIEIRNAQGTLLLTATRVGEAICVMPAAGRRLKWQSDSVGWAEFEYLHTTSPSTFQVTIMT